MAHHDDFEYTTIDCDEDLEVEDLLPLMPMAHLTAQDIFRLESPITSSSSSSSVENPHWYEFRQTLDYNTCEYNVEHDFFLLAPSCSESAHPYDSPLDMFNFNYDYTKTIIFDFVSAPVLANPIEKRRKVVRQLFV